MLDALSSSNYTKMGNLSALGGLGGLNNINGFKSINLANATNDFLGSDGIDTSNLENPLSELGILENQGINNISGADTELKADLKGFVQKTQDYQNNFSSEGEGIGAGEVADKFSNIIGNYINDVNSKSREAQKAVETFVTGGNIDMHSVMIASEKAGLSMQLALQLKNKIVQAYQEISRTTV